MACIRCYRRKLQHIWNVNDTIPSTLIVIKGGGGGDGGKTTSNTTPLRLSKDI